MKPTEFEYARPRDLAEALTLLSKEGISAKLLAGGQSLVPMMNFRTVSPEVLVDINGLDELHFCKVEDGRLRIGALMRHGELFASEVVADACPLMHEAYRYVAHHAVRNRGTLAGNLSHADPASEMPAVMLACDATFVLQSQAGRRDVPAKDFFLGPLETALRDDEILIEVAVPVTRQLGWAFDETSMRHGDFAMAGVAVKLGVASDGSCHSTAIALCGVSGKATRIPEADDCINNSPLTATSIARCLDVVRRDIDFTESPGVSASFREHVTSVLVERALNAAYGTANKAD